MSYWIVSAEETHGNDSGWYQRRCVIRAIHPIVWAKQYEGGSRVTIRLLFWEKITPQMARRLKAFRDIDE